MMQYANGFSCALSADSGELIIRFLQQSPVFKEDGSTEESKVNEVTEIIMPNNVAKQLAYALDSLANSESEH